MKKTSTPPKNWREERRMQAWKLHEKGWKQKDIAEALGVTEGAVSQWFKKAKKQGVETLRHKSPPGATPKLSPEQMAQLPTLLEQGAEAFGFRGQVWTTARVAQMIKQEFGVSYHPAHCSLLLRKLKWTQQKPIEKATQRDEEAIRRWKEVSFDQLKKQAKAEGRTIVFVDESSFYLLPMAVRTYSPRGQTPVLRVKLSYDHLSAIGGITPEGRIFMQTQNHSYKGPDVVRFLQLLEREIPGKIMVIWDGASIHRCEVLKAFLAKRGSKRIRIEPLPAYAPELNPQEGVWNLLKRVELKNVCCLNLQHVQQELLHAKERLRHHKSTLSQCYAHAGYSL
jgi:transposase